MKITSMRGFGARNTSRDRLIILSGAYAYITTGLPGASQSTTALQQSTPASDFRAPFYDDSSGGVYSTTGGAAWFHIRYRTAAISATNQTLLFLGLGRSGTKMIGVSAENTTGKMTLVVAGNVRATAAVFAYGVGTWERIHIHIGGLSTGNVINVYANGNLASPVLTYTLIAADQTNLSAIGSSFNEFRISGKGGAPATEAYDDMFVVDPAASGSVSRIQQLGEASIAEQVFTGNGAEVDWTGSYTDIDERPNSDTDKLTATAVGDESSFTKPSIISLGVDNVYAVQVMTRITRTDTTAGQNLRISLKEGANTGSQLLQAPSDGDAMHVFQLAPDGTPWTPDLYDLTRVMFTAET